jgi:hypothetical protein
VAVTVDTAADAYAKIVATAGCSLHRDAVDLRLITELASLGTKGKTLSQENKANAIVKRPKMKRSPLQPAWVKSKAALRQPMPIMTAFPTLGKPPTNLTPMTWRTPRSSMPRAIRPSKFTPTAWSRR